MNSPREQGAAMAICGMQSSDCPYPTGPDRDEWRIGYRNETRKVQRGMAKFKMEQADRLAEVYRLKACRLEIALTNVIYEITHLSLQRDDGSHDCRISGNALAEAREALRARRPEGMKA
jgi:hypothetical protein